MRHLLDSKGKDKFQILFLDAYYLSLEIRFRDRHNDFIRKLDADDATIEDLFIVTPGRGFRNIAKSSIKALLSLSVWPFYGLLIAMMFNIRFWLL